MRNSELRDAMVTLWLFVMRKILYTLLALAGGAFAQDGMQLLSFSNGAQDASIAQLTNGNVAIAFTTSTDDIGYAIVNPSTGAVVRSNTLLNDGPAEKPDIVALDNGGFAIIYQDNIAGDDDKDIDIRIYDAAGVQQGNRTLDVTGATDEAPAIAQLANGKYLGISLKEGDTFLFSSKTIPGNERGVIRIMNQFSEQGVDVIDDSSGLYHVSGHANRPDIMEMHRILNPVIQGGYFLIANNL